MPQLRLIDTTWGDVQTLAPSALGTEHEPMCEVVLPVPGVIAIAWRLGVLNNPAGLAWLDAEEWTKPADAQRPYKIMANRYDGRPVYPGEQVWSDD